MRAWTRNKSRESHWSILCRLGVPYTTESCSAGGVMKPHTCIRFVTLKRTGNGRGGKFIPDGSLYPNGCALTSCRSSCWQDSYHKLVMCDSTTSTIDLAPVRTSQYAGCYCAQHVDTCLQVAPSALNAHKSVSVFSSKTILWLRFNTSMRRSSFLSITS